VGAGVQQGGGFRLHIGPEVVPGTGHLILGKVDFVRDLFHVSFSFHHKKEAAQVNLCRLVHESLSLHGFKHRKSTLLKDQ
jgi:hypothetical protein